MKISFIVISFNGQNNIQNCLRTIITLAGDFESEIIFVDDGSTDATVNCVEKIRKIYSSIKICKNATNHGRAFSRNEGISAATGDYIFFVDDDDFIIPLAFENLLSELDKNPDILIPARLDFNLKTRKFFSSSHTDRLYRGIRQFTKASDFPACFRDNFITGKFIKRQMLVKNKIRFNDAQRNAEDILFATQIFLYSQHTIITTDLFYAYGRGNYKKNFDKVKLTDVLKNNQKILTLWQVEKTTVYNQHLVIKYATILLETVKRQVEKTTVYNQHLVIKYATILLETIKRADGVLDVETVCDVIKSCYIPITNDNELKTLNQQPNLLRLITDFNSGNFLSGVKRTNTVQQKATKGPTDFVIKAYIDKITALVQENKVLRDELK